MLKTASVIGYLGMAGGAVALLATRNLFSSSPLVIAIQAAAVLLFVWARLTFGRRSFHLAANPTEGGLVTSGPYRYIRHPIYAAVCLFIAPGVAAHWSWASALSAGLVLAGAVARILCEETLVTARYPEYARYRTRTWRMVPYIY